MGYVVAGENNEQADVGRVSMTRRKLSTTYSVHDEIRIA
jgi:hypothetical protein